mmetsp:Transcript_34523/g.67936  ORF Transcript_34523/g.67936 Transcript_34523/m.67936 type:complete len:186 (+) Transcript_34523:78-635(+)
MGCSGSSEKSSENQPAESGAVKPSAQRDKANNPKQKLLESSKSQHNDGSGCDDDDVDKDFSSRSRKQLSRKEQQQQAERKRAAAIAKREALAKKNKNDPNFAVSGPTKFTKTLKSKKDPENKKPTASAHWASVRNAVARSNNDEDKHVRQVVDHVIKLKKKVPPHLPAYTQDQYGNWVHKWQLAS